MGLLALAGTAVAGTGHQWDDLHWGTRGEGPTLDLRYSFSPASQSEWMPIYLTGSRNAFAKWNDDPRSPLTMRDFGEAFDKDPAECDPDSYEILVCSAEYGQAVGWTGQSQIWSSGDQVVRANSKMNDSFFDYSASYDRPERREFTMCHELGHAIGLGHLDEDFRNDNLGSCMDYTSDVLGARDNRSPGQQDWDVLTSATMYGPVAATGPAPAPVPGPTVVEPEPEPAPAPETDRFAVPDPTRDRGNLARGEWVGAVTGNLTTTAQRNLPAGRFGGILEYDAKGRPIAFVKDLRGGRKVTFVMWADDYRPEDSVDPDRPPRGWQVPQHPR